MLATASYATADEPGGASSTYPQFALNGFGTLGLAQSPERRADYTFDNLQPTGAGRSNELTFYVDTRFGAQLTGHWGDRWSAVVQMVTEYRPNGSYEPFVSWANVKYAITPDLSVRAGRISLPSFLESDSRRVGYSNITARPPIEVYRLLALKESDGVDAAYRFHIDGATNTTTLLYGHADVTNSSGTTVHSTKVAGVFDTVEFERATLHAAYQVRDVDNQAPQLGRFMSLGASYDPGIWFASSEWVKAINFNGKGVKATRVGWYVNGGRRFGLFSPYITVSELLPTTNTHTIPIGQRTFASGVRWDVRRNIDLKLQWDDIRLANNSYGTLQNVAPSMPKGGRVNVYSAMADFIF
jgi:hypothetical protein